VTLCTEREKADAAAVTNKTENPGECSPRADGHETGPMGEGDMRQRFGEVACAAAIAALLAMPAAAQANKTVDAIKERGQVACGVSTGMSTGMSTLDDQGNWEGLEVDFCRALAAALLGDATKVNFVPLEFKVAFASLQSGAVDLLARTGTWTYSRDAELNLDWAGIYIYDGQGFMVAKDLGVTSAKDLDGATICVTGGSTTELTLADYFRTNGMSFTPIVGNGRDQNQQNLEAGRCDVYTNEIGGLASSRTAMANPDDWVLLPEVLSKEPTGPIVRQDDPRFRDIVYWTLAALVAAEEYDVTQANVREMATSSTNPEVKRILGTEGEFGPMLGLAKDWAVTVIEATGNYGEIFDRNLGEGSRVKLARGLNQLWSNGGLLYAPPFR
jgi:general L-amino acid transport system substrate-binding protein